MIFTIGHSTHRIERFIELLQMHGVNEVVDVRSVPHSRFNPQFNRQALTHVLRDNDIGYVFMGNEFGARSKDPECYEDDRVSYEKLAQTESFKHGLERLIAASSIQTMALMCAEKEPLECHRTLLVARALEKSGISTSHILSDGSIEPHAVAMARLKRQLHLPEHDLFRSDAELLEQAYRIQSQRIAYVKPSGNSRIRQR